MISEFKDEYRWLSNFWPCTVTHEGIEYPSVEHFYVAMKTVDKNERLMISKLQTAGQAKRHGKTIKVRKDWEDIRVGVMLYGLVQKFQTPRLKNLLIQTEDSLLEEGNTWKDVFWGVDIESGVGQNILGKLLMGIRKAINDRKRFVKLAIIGGRDFTDDELFTSLMKKTIEDENLFVYAVISGGAKGADKLGKEWAEKNNRFYIDKPADWAKYGKSAGPIRNQEIINECDFVVAFPTEQSKGTWNSIKLADGQKKPTKIHRV